MTIEILTRRVAPCGTEAAHRRHRRHHEPIDNACRQARNNVEAARKRHEYEQTRERQLNQLSQQLIATGVQVFHGIRCADCGTGLHNGNGEPRWEIHFPMRFVCQGGCRRGELR